MGIVAEAEKNILNYKKEVSRNVISYTALRNIYSLVLDTTKKKCTIDDVEYLKMKIMYQIAKDNSNVVKKFENELKIIKKINLILETSTKETLRQDLLKFKTYMEAVVSYYKYYIGGK